MQHPEEIISEFADTRGRLQRPLPTEAITCPEWTSMIAVPD